MSVIVCFFNRSGKPRSFGRLPLHPLVRLTLTCVAYCLGRDSAANVSKLLYVQFPSQRLAVWSPLYERDWRESPPTERDAVQKLRFFSEVFERTGHLEKFEKNKSEDLNFRSDFFFLCVGDKVLFFFRLISFCASVVWLKT